MHAPYESQLKRSPDFRVRYRFYTSEQGGRKTLPVQGIRSDFWYDHPDHQVNSIFMIWPEFEDKNTGLVLDNGISATLAGTARMWIVNEETRSYHKERIAIGTKGWFREGSRATGECEVIEILSLNEI